MLDKLKFIEDERTKKAFYASDYGKPLFDLWCAFRGIPPTNPPEWYDTLKWGAGKGAEMAMLKVLKDSDIVNDTYVQERDGRIEIQREGVQINGYIDAITKQGKPIEIKTINNKNSFDILKYRKQSPRENYVGQLSIYLDAKDLESGYLFVSSIDGLDRFWFEAQRIGFRKFKCGDVVVDLDKQYKKWSEFKRNYLDRGEDKEYFSEYQYKYDIEKLDWKKVSKNDIQKARNGQKVIGDWQVQWSPWKDLIIQQQGQTLGYTKEEIVRIKELTDGYTNW